VREIIFSCYHFQKFSCYNLICFQIGMEVWVRRMNYFLSAFGQTIFLEIEHGDWNIFFSFFTYYFGCGRAWGWELFSHTILVAVERGDGSNLFLLLLIHYFHMGERNLHACGEFFSSSISNIFLSYHLDIFYINIK